MSDDKKRVEVVSAHNHHDRHHFGLGVLTGATMGAVVALLFTPRTGADMRHEIGHQWTRAKGNCTTGYRKAKGTASDWTERGRHAYDVARTKVSKGARETRQYVQEVSNAVTRKAHHKEGLAHSVEKKTDYAMMPR